MNYHIRIEHPGPEPLGHLMIYIGIVGAEAAKFTKRGEERARQIIRDILSNGEAARTLVSGRCHLGGVDIWAEEIAQELGCFDPKYIFPPATHSWETGYKPRNLQIAFESHIVHCITVDRLPEGFSGMRFSRCYHCNRTDHVKSGGCWTMKKAMRTERTGHLHIVENT